MEDPVVVVKKQDTPDETWFRYECSYNRQDIEDEMDFVFDTFENPEKLEQYKPSEWKCKNKSHWKQYKQIMDEKFSKQSEDCDIHFYGWESKVHDMILVYAEELNLDEKFNIERNGKRYKIYIDKILDDVPEGIKEDVGDEYDVGIAIALSRQPYK